MGGRTNARDDVRMVPVDNLSSKQSPGTSENSGMESDSDGSGAGPSGRGGGAEHLGATGSRVQATWACRL
jgi:hypothetical protein